MSKLYRDLSALLRQQGWRFERQGRGDHEIWTHSDRSFKLTIDKGMTKPHSANAVLKQAKLPKAF